MPRENYGEVISLIWEGKPEAFFVKGHVSEGDALAELEEQEVLVSGYEDYKLPEQDCWVWLRAKLSPSYHRYARWSTEAGPDDCCQVLRDYKEPGRGRFPVTMFYVLDWEKVSKEEAYPKSELNQKQ